MDEAVLRIILEDEARSAQSQSTVAGMGSAGDMVGSNSPAALERKQTREIVNALGQLQKSVIDTSQTKGVDSTRTNLGHMIDSMRKMFSGSGGSSSFMETLRAPLTALSSYLLGSKGSKPENYAKETLEAMKSGHKELMGIFGETHKHIASIQAETYYTIPHILKDIHGVLGEVKDWAEKGASFGGNVLASSQGMEKWLEIIANTANPNASKIYNELEDQQKRDLLESKVNPGMALNPFDHSEMGIPYEQMYPFREVKKGLPEISGRTEDPNNLGFQAVGLTEGPDKRTDEQKRIFNEAQERKKGTLDYLQARSDKARGTAGGFLGEGEERPALTGDSTAIEMIANVMGKALGLVLGGNIKSYSTSNSPQILSQELPSTISESEQSDPGFSWDRWQEEQSERQRLIEEEDAIQEERERAAKAEWDARNIPDDAELLPATPRSPSYTIPDSADSTASPSSLGPMRSSKPDTQLGPLTVDDSFNIDLTDPEPTVPQVAQPEPAGATTNTGKRLKTGNTELKKGGQHLTPEQWGRIIDTGIDIGDRFPQGFVSDDILKRAREWYEAKGESLGFATGGWVGDHPGGPKGTDTIPAWLSEGEFVVNAQSAAANRGHLEAINNSRSAMTMSRGGRAHYLALGSMVGKGISAASSAAQGVMSAASMAASSGTDPAEAISGLGSAVGAAGSALAKFAPIAGTAVQAIGAVAQGFATLMQAIDGTVERYGEYSPQIAQAQAMAEIKQALGDMKRAQEIGNDLARYVDTRAQLQQGIEDAKVEFMKSIVPMVVDLLKVQRDLKSGLDSIGADEFMPWKLLKDALDYSKSLYKAVAEVLSIKVKEQAKIEDKILDPTEELLGSKEFREGGKNIPNL